MEKVIKQTDFLSPADRFVDRHVGPRAADIEQMLELLGFESLEALTSAVVPDAIQLDRKLTLDAPLSEHQLLAKAGELAGRNEVFRSYIGMGYSDCITPPVIQRNILENPGWYTQYTPYQAEIAQGRLEALINFQTMIADLCGLPLANASLLDEGTAAAEAMAMCRAITRGKKPGFFVAQDCHPQTIEVVGGRATPLGIDLSVGDVGEIDFESGGLFGVLLQYPVTTGEVRDYTDLVAQAHEAGALVVVACDLLALTLLRPPGEFGADIAVGSSQRFGVPLGFGGPHAAFIATREAHQRQMPGRIVGASKDDAGDTAYRLALQTREQHIRRDKATSNICTAQALLAIMAGMYAAYHGPDGLRRIANRIHGMTVALAEGLRRIGHELSDEPVFDTLHVRVNDGATDRIVAAAEGRRINLRRFDDDTLGISLDETTDVADLSDLLEVFADGRSLSTSVEELAAVADLSYPAPLARESGYLAHEVFQRYHSEHELLRYIHRLQNRDLSLTHSMIALGSCTMKLNGTAQLQPISWREFSGIHPFVPKGQIAGYRELFGQLEGWLSEITGHAAASLQPNAGAQGEYAGLLVIRAYHEQRGEGHRNICLLPTSAHGTNPASAVMAGYKVVLVECDDRGNVEAADLKAKAELHRDSLAALMITYPSTHGVFEDSIQQICATIHDNGGQVYLDGANMNAQVGLCRPAEIGADVCHLNLHKTFCIPHGGGGPGMGPITVAAHLAPFLPGHPLVEVGGDDAIAPVSAASHGSAGILPISWAYIALMGEPGLRKATQVAILNANYMARKLAPHYPILYTGEAGLVAHEFILDLRPIKEATGITVDDVAKRLMDFGLHAPTMSFPVVGTLMIEPTESESLEELERFCESMILIRQEIRDVAEGRADRENNVLKRAPHTAPALLVSEWDRPYSREVAAFPAPWVRHNKFWPAVGRIDNVWGDRNLICTCDPIDSYR